MVQLQFAFWDSVGGYAEQDVPMADVYDEHIRLAQRLEELGWHSYFVIEHQNSPVGRITAPTVFLTAVARATSTLRLYRHIWQECNHPGPMPHVFLQRQVHVAETDTKAHEEARQFIASPTGSVVRVGGGPIAQTRIGWGMHARGMGRDSERPDDKARGETMRMAAQSYEFNLENGLAVVGNPETVIRQLEEGKKSIGYDIFCTNHEIGRMPKPMVRNSIALFGKEVIPAFR